MGHVRRQAQERPRRGVRQRRAAGIVDGDVPAAHFRHHPPGQLAIAGDQGRGLLRCVKRRPQDQRDRLGFFPRRRAVQAAQAVGGLRPQGAGQLAPGVRGSGGAHQLADQPPPARQGRAPVPHGRRRPIRHHAAIPAHGLYQPLQPGLGMAVLQGIPAFVVHIPVQAGQDDGTRRQPGNHGQQIGGGRDRAGGPGGDHRRCRRPRPPQLGLQGQHPVAPVGRIDDPAFGQDPRPGVADDGQEVDRLLPMPGQGFRHKIGQPVEAQAFGMDLVDQAGQLVGQAQGLGRPQRRFAPGQDQPGQQHAPPAARNRRRQVGGRRQARRRLGFDLQRLRVDIAQGAHPRQQGRPAVGLAQERVPQRPHGAPGRQQDPHGAQRQGVAAGAVQKAGGQRVDERHAGRDGEDAGGIRRGHRSSQRMLLACIACCTSLKAAGEPTWNQTPSWTMP